MPETSSTPILDRQQSVPAPKRRRRDRIIALAVGVAIGLALPFAPGDVGRELGGSPLLFPLFFFSAVIVGVIAHELGHWAAGAAVGFEFHHIRASGLMLRKESGGYRFRFLPVHLLGGGQTLMVPRTPDDLRRRFFLYGAGGPLATALLFLPVVLLPWSGATASFLLANLALAFVSWAPLVVRGHYTDGKLLLLLARQGPSSERLAAALYVMAMDSSGAEPRHWPPDALKKLSLDEGADFRASSRFLLYVHARDGGAPPEAAAALEHALSTAAEMHPALRRTSFAEASFFQGAISQNATLARAWLEDARNVKAAVSEKDWDAHSLAGIALAEGNQDQAREYLSRAIAFLDRHPGASGSRAAARARLVELSSAGCFQSP